MVCKTSDTNTDRRKFALQDISFPWERNEYLIIFNWRKMEKDGLIVRNVYADVSTRVEYGLSEMGASMLTILKEIRKWGLERAAQELPVKCFYCEQCKPLND